tara:strand:+ start:24890 stop:30631 length:5742 start_codon:yes stop_codon:yes gene_type:complete
MEEEQIIKVKEIDNYMIPERDIYKIHILNEEGNVQYIFIFCAGLRSSNDMSAIFSEIELAFYKRNDVEIIFSENLIHPDDTIRDIKHKIVNEIVEFQKKSKTKEFMLSVEEIYMFGLSEKDLDMTKLYQEITDNDTKQLTKEKFFQYATNISSNPYDLDKGDGEKGGLYNDVFTYEQWIGLSNSGLKELYTPIGMEFQNTYDFMFPTNPYKNQLWTETIRYESARNNPLLTLERSILLDYTKKPDIMVCLAKDSFQFAEKNNINPEYFCELYYPFLFKSGLTNTSLLSESAIKIAEETKKYNNPKNTRRNNITQIYREIYWNATEEMAYSEKGIKQFSFTIKPYDYVQNFPLDLLFRNLHASEKIPFIKYNPGTRRENMYRLYSDNISSDGKKIPALEESIIMRLSRDIGKAKQISLFVKESFGIVVNIHNNSEIEILGQLTKLLSIEELNSEVTTLIKPITERLNNILQPSGYKIRPFSFIEDDNIINTRLTYQSHLPIDTKINLQKQIDYITPIFDILSMDVSKGANLRFKRIKNYKEMDAKNAFIREIYDRTANSDEVIQGLMDNFDLQQDAAVIAFAEFKSQFQLLKQKVAENPGFKTIFQMKPLKSELLVEVTDINSIRYVQELEIYIDVILRLSQKPKTVKISSEKLKRFKSKEKSVPVVQEVVETIVVPQEKGVELYNPLRFSPEEEQDAEEVVEEEGEGIDFDDADYYGEYEEEDLQEESDEEEFYGGQETPEEEEKYKTDIDGMPIKNPTPFFKRMLELDPTLYVTEESSKFPLYSKACPSGDRRQPIILTDAEKKKIDETNPGSYGHALYHGSSEDKKHWYICPRYWCLKTNSSISEEDVKAGKCGAIIPRGSDKVPPGAYVYEFNNPKNHMKDGKYVQHVPGLLKKDKHPDGLCIPCCFGKSWDSNDQVKRRQICGLEEEKEDDNTKKKKKNILTDGETKNNKTLSYIISSVSYPLPQNRWGFLPLALQIFFKSDASQVVDPKNTAVIRGGEKCLLRYGVEKSETQSFLACFAYFYAYKQGLSKVPTIEEMREEFVNAIDIDMFVRYHNGNLVSTFRSKQRGKTVDLGPHQESDFYKTISLNDETQLEYLENTVLSYNNFIDFIKNENSVIDHTYLWDFFCGRNNNLLKDGMNLIILQMTDQDITERVQLICPSNAYSKFEYDETKETVILLKQDNFYEPIHLYEQKETIIKIKSENIVYDFKKGDVFQNGKVISSTGNIEYKVKQGETKKNEVIFKKAFVEVSALSEIKSVLKLIKETSKKYCRPLPSLPKKYNFKQNIPLMELMRLLKTYHYKIDSQVLNYRNKVIGVTINKEDTQSLLFVPCFPSAMVKGLKTKFMDDVDLWLDYRTTRDRLNGLSRDTGGKIMSKPQIKIIEDGLVIGFLTETNQFVQINPPTQPIDQDQIPEVKHYSNRYNDDEKHKSAEKTLTIGENEKSERVNIVRNVNLETQFYNIFRTIVRIYLNKFEYRQIRREILETIDDLHYSYRGKLITVEKELRKLLENKIDFRDIDVKDLSSIERVVLCNDGDNCLDDKDRPSYCLMSDDGNCISVFPKKHLLSGSDNNKIYFGRMADELVRYKRSRLFMFYPKNYMNITNTDFYINNDELFMLETRLTRDYFRNIVPFGSNKINQNITFDSAQPDMEYSGNIQNYSNKVTLQEQNDFSEKSVEIKKNMSDFIIDCIEHTKPNVVGNNKEGSWRKIFPVTAKELFFHKTVNCSFIPIIYIIQEVYFSTISIQNIKTSLWRGYKGIFKSQSAEKYVYSILRKQGKSALMDKIKKKQANFEEIIFSDEYYITDLDWWVFCTVASLPVVLFSSTSLKTLSPMLQWVRLGGKSVDQKHFFVRSPAEIKTNVPPGYHVVQNGYTFNQLKSDIFIKASRGDVEYVNNMQTVEEFLSKATVLKR